MYASCSSHYDEINEVVDQSVLLTKSVDETSSVYGKYDVDFKLLKKYLRLSGKDKKQHSILLLQSDELSIDDFLSLLKRFSKPI